MRLTAESSSRDLAPLRPPTDSQKQSLLEDRLQAVLACADDAASCMGAALRRGPQLRRASRADTLGQWHCNGCGELLCPTLGAVAEQGGGGTIQAEAKAALRRGCSRYAPAAPIVVHVCPPIPVPIAQLRAANCITVNVRGCDQCRLCGKSLPREQPHACASFLLRAYKLDSTQLHYLHCFLQEVARAPSPKEFTFYHDIAGATVRIVYIKEHQLYVSPELDEREYNRLKAGMMPPLEATYLMQCRSIMLGGSHHKLGLHALGPLWASRDKVSKPQVVLKSNIDYDPQFCNAGMLLVYGGVAVAVQGSTAAGGGGGDAGVEGMNWRHRYRPVERNTLSHMEVQDWPKGIHALVPGMFVCSTAESINGAHGDSCNAMMDLVQRHHHKLAECVLYVLTDLTCGEEVMYNYDERADEDDPPGYECVCPTCLEGNHPT
ncbi:MAG: hypothetical protein J3K34DRAFT_436338 [Monoraphidium minutum]|nr:MAG: hypothetical protein J3K34DRAFT_436338 [Monoraphidium minutum]